MSIIDLSKKLQDDVHNYGRYRQVSEQSGVSYEWLIKFVNGKIPNPGINNVEKLRQFFNDQKDFDAA